MSMFCCVSGAPAGTPVANSSIMGHRISIFVRRTPAPSRAGLVVVARRTKGGEIEQTKFDTGMTGLKIKPFGSLTRPVKKYGFGEPTLYPEWGEIPGQGKSPIVPFTDEKNAAREIMHGRWAMLGVAGAWAAEVGTGIPWFEAGKLCSPDSCTVQFPGPEFATANVPFPADLIKEDYKFWGVLVSEVVLLGFVEGYRTGLLENPFPELDATGDNVSPGMRFDPYKFAETGDLEELKIKELKHCRLAMGAWFGLIFQAFATKEGPIQNWAAHVADPVHVNVFSAYAETFA